jgi:hypothetical protein
MSTYLKTAAMSLLSKTLQTFLYKYLSDVDVEGVALPSVYDGSGWGVRLSNVQLREGVELMKELPGKVTKKRKRKRKIRKRRQRPKEDPKTEQLKRELFGQRESGDKRSTNEPINPQASEVVLDSVGKSHEREDKFYSTDEEENDSDNAAAARPTTPVQESKSMFSCFYNSRGSKTIPENSLHSNKKALQKRSSLPEEHTNKSDTKPPPKRQLSAPAGTNTLPSTKEKPSHVEELQNIQDEGDGLQDNDDYDEYEYEEEFYEEDCQVPMRLCLGENGHIGTLDVRLIGKELHVMVEDAVVTIEVIPVLIQEEEEDQELSDVEVSSSESQEGDGNRPTEDRDATTSSTQPKKPTAEPKRDTVGDRVLADNPLARLISAIPHLFLRDIRIRLIIRDKPMTVSPSNDEDAASSSVKSEEEAMLRPESSTKDIMVEIGIDFLSVGSGEDILSHFQQSSEDESQTAALDPTTSEALAALGERSSQPPALLKIPSYAGVDGRDQKNEFLFRHIRTGKGPAAGIFLQVFAPSPKLPTCLFKRPSKVSSDSGTSVLWARQQWMASSENVFLRCSGLDIQARIHMGTRAAEGIGYSWFGDMAEEDDGSDYDSMFLLAGMDTIAPGPQLPLPPMEPRMSRGATPGGKGSGISEESTEKTEMENFTPGTMHPGADTYETDKNGIQSCKIPSTFHRVSRGMEPGSCKSCKHIPSEICRLCWERASPDIPLDSSLDSSLPMPGLVIQIGVRDRLEINVDRESLESLGLLKSLFTKPAKIETEEAKPDTPGDIQSASPAPVLAESATQTTASSTGFFSSMIYGTPVEQKKEEEPSESFESYMQPETITVMGVYVAEVSLRIHILKENRQDGGLSFAYWHVGIDCLTLDRHTLISKEKTYQDLELDLGRLQCDEYSGVNRKTLCTLGLKLPVNRGRCDSQTSAASMLEDHEQTKVPWPSTACALLDIPPPLESLVYKSRERHGVQLRFVSLSGSSGGKIHSKSLIHARLGVTTVDTPLAVRFDFFRVFDEVMNNLVRTRPRNVDEALNNGKQVDKQPKSKEQLSDSCKTWMSYTVQVDSGDIKLPPTVNLKLPLTRFCGERSSVAGISFESVLDKIELAYGTTERKSQGKCLTLPQISELPENARMHILLCLQDLSPLEQALGVKKEKNPFRRIKTVDKSILKLAKKISGGGSKVSQRNAALSLSDHSNQSIPGFESRRHKVLNEILKMDDEQLAELWSVHQRYQKKVSKKRRDL